ncbi:MAG: cell wall-binding repeat-containing protein [Actinomycetota bacterium]|nr:cell wall-binding repeat-containing protein [Actinomycetota bacterium]
MNVPLPGTSRVNLISVLALVVSLLGSIVIVASPARAAPHPGLERLEGADAVSIGLSVSRQSFPVELSASSVVLARTEEFADALAASAVAGKYGGPILFTPRDGLEPSVRAEVQRILPRGYPVFLMGPPAAIDSSIERELRDQLGYKVFRFSGEHRIHTAALAAYSVGPGPAGSAILTRSQGPKEADTETGWVESVACGSYAAKTSTPVLLTNPNAPELHAWTRQAIRDLQVRRVIICGDDAVVPRSHADQLASMGVAVERYAGSTPVLTAVDVARRLWAYADAAAAGKTYFAIPGFGPRFAYGLAAAPLAAKRDAPMLLVGFDFPTACHSREPSTGTLCYLEGEVGANAQRAGAVVVVGSTSVISEPVAVAVADSAGLTRDTNPPAVPGDVVASDLPEDDGTHVRVTWKASSDPEGGPVLYRVSVRPADATAEYTPATQEPVSETSLDVGGLTKERRYEFVVAAVDQFGNASAPSAPAAASPTDEVPQAPRSGPNAVGEANGITVSWVEAPEADAFGYQLERAEVRGGSAGLSDCESTLMVLDTAYAEVAQVQGKANTTYLDQQAESGRQYCYRYRVFDNSNPPNHSGYSPATLAARSMPSPSPS